MLAGEPGILIVGESCTAANTISQALQLTPDVILLDDRFPDGIGSTTCRTLSEINADSKVILVALEDSAQVFHAAFETGARGYVLQCITREELLQAVRAVASGTSYIDRAAVPRLFTALQGGRSPSPFCESELPDLSPQQLRILPLLTEGKTNKEIALALALSDKTVKNYLATMFKKLRVTNRAHAAAIFVRAQRQTSA
jgi:DNA-binding NarL/FixJ family response regulator